MRDESPLARAGRAPSRARPPASACTARVSHAEARRRVSRQLASERARDQPAPRAPARSAARDCARARRGRCGARRAPRRHEPLARPVRGVEVRLAHVSDERNEPRVASPAWLPRLAPERQGEASQRVDALDPKRRRAESTSRGLGEQIAARARLCVRAWQIYPRSFAAERPSGRRQPPREPVGARASRRWMVRSGSGSGSPQRRPCCKRSSFQRLVYDCSRRRDGEGGQVRRDIAQGVFTAKGRVSWPQLWSFAQSSAPAANEGVPCKRHASGAKGYYLRQHMAGAAGPNRGQVCFFPLSQFSRHH